jgi:uncharacterized LabA/DUF88 family protein
MSAALLAVSDCHTCIPFQASTDSQRSLNFLAVRGRTMLFIDGPNLHHSAREAKLTVSYRELCSESVGWGSYAGARFYIAITGNAAHDGFLAHLRGVGITVLSRPIICYPDQMQHTDVDTWIATDMIRLSHLFDTLVLASGDGDFVYTVQALQEMGKAVEVWGFPGSTAKELRAVANLFVDITHRGRICIRQVAADEEEQAS